MCHDFVSGNYENVISTEYLHIRYTIIHADFFAMIGVDSYLVHRRLEAVYQNTCTVFIFYWKPMSPPTGFTCQMVALPIWLDHAKKKRTN